MTTMKIFGENVEFNNDEIESLSVGLIEMFLINIGVESLNGIEDKHKVCLEAIKAYEEDAIKAIIIAKEQGDI